MLPIYLDQSPKIAIIKSVQCGISEYLVVVSMAEMMRGHKVLYILPTDTDRNNFIFERIDGAVKQVPLYEQGAGRIDNVGMKQFWGGGIKSVGSNRLGNFKSFACQCVIIDELDECNTKHLAFTEDRTAATRILLGRDPRVIRVSNPTTAGRGIDAEFKAGDMKRYFFKCDHCGEWQHLTWFEHIIEKTGVYEYRVRDESWDPRSDKDVGIPCQKCGHLIDRENSKQEWIAEHPENDYSTYHISQLFTYQFPIRSLLTRYDESIYDQSKMQNFYNSYLGLPYSGDGDQLTDDDFDGCVIDDYTLPKTASRTVAGVDVGRLLNVSIDTIESGCRRMAYRGTVPSFEELARLLRRYKPRRTVIDARPELHKARDFQNDHKDLNVWLCEYVPTDNASRGELKEVERYDPGMGSRPTKVVQVNRTESLDAMVADIHQGLFICPKNWRQIDGGKYRAQMQASTRKLVEKVNQSGMVTSAYVWTEDNLDDHYFHSDNYSHIAARMINFSTGLARVTRL